MKGCGLILGVYNFSILNNPIKLKCGDIIWDELRDIKRKLLCSKCQGALDKNYSLKKEEEKKQ